MESNEFTRAQDDIDMLQQEMAQQAKVLAVHEAVCSERYEGIQTSMRRVTGMIGILLLFELFKQSFPDMVKSLLLLFR